MPIAGAGWGIGRWGLAGFGGIQPLQLVSVYAAGPRHLTLTLSAPPQNISPYMDGDVQKPTTWQVSRGDTGAPLIVAGVKPKKPPLVWDIHLLLPMGPFPVVHTISSLTLLSAGGAPLVLPRSLTFTGTRMDHPLVGPESTRPQGVLDLRNDSLFGNGAGITPGDGAIYKVHNKQESLKKRLLRRAMTRPGELAYDPTYGVGIRVKEPAPARSIPELQQKCTEQFLKEPDIVSVRVQVKVLPENVLVLDVHATGDFGTEDISLTFAAVQF